MPFRRLHLAMIAAVSCIGIMPITAIAHDYNVSSQVSPIDAKIELPFRNQVAEEGKDPVDCIANIDWFIVVDPFHRTVQGTGVGAKATLHCFNFKGNTGTLMIDAQIAEGQMGNIHTVRSDPQAEQSSTSPSVMSSVFFPCVQDFHPGLGYLWVQVAAEYAPSSISSTNVPIYTHGFFMPAGADAQLPLFCSNIYKKYPTRQPLTIDFKANVPLIGNQGYSG